MTEGLSDALNARFLDAPGGGRVARHNAVLRGIAGRGGRAGRFSLILLI